MTPSRTTHRILREFVMSAVGSAERISKSARRPVLSDRVRSIPAVLNNCWWRQLRQLDPSDPNIMACGKLISASRATLMPTLSNFDTTPGKDISAELDRLHKSHLFKIYPVIGKTSDDGHNLLYLGISD